jgi:lipid II:glycine glycyltransferase (peptidoglycan interpeptide bridge formation enzyme)
MERSWVQFIESHTAGNILQTTLWGSFKSDFGWSWDLVFDGQMGAISYGAMILRKALPFRVGCIAYVPRGPLVDWENQNEVEAVLSLVETAAAQKKAWAVWLEPELSRDASALDVLRNHGYHQSTRTIQPSSTIIVDISDDEDAILMQMKSKTRYNIRLSKRKGVHVREGGLEDIDIFYRLMQITSERDEFGIHSKQYRSVLEYFLPVNQAGLIIASVEDTPVAALLILILGTKSWYIAGASSNEYRKLMPTYAAQWGAICWAKARGCLSYDLWGVPDSDEETLEAEFTQRNDGLWGVYRFKRGFGGKLVRYAGLWVKPLHPLYTLGEKFYSGLIM